MSGTKAGGKKAAATNKQRYGLDFYQKNGRKGGQISRGGGFAMSHALAVEAGRKGGKARRHPVREEAVVVEEQKSPEKVRWLKRIGLVK